MTFEKLLQETEKEGIEVIEMHFKGGLKGLYCDNIIALSKSLVNDTERKCVLAEELGHHYKTVGNILDQSNIVNRKQERIARAWGYERLVGVESLINAYKYGVRNRYELAEYLGVTEEYIDDALKYYNQKYGLYYQLNNYIIYFDPLVVLKIWE